MQNREETTHLRPNGEEGEPIKMGDISNIEDAMMLDTHNKNARNKKIFYFAIGGFIIIALILAIVLPLSLKSKQPFVQEATFNGTFCANKTQTLLLQNKLSGVTK
jgi:hypothetical protein